MKRNDMILDLQDFLFGLLSYEGGFNDDDFAKQVLDFIEEKGMLPPAKNYVIEYNNKDQLEGIHMMRKAHIWEPQNEKK